MGEGRLATDQKKAKRLKASLVFLDESGFSLKPNVVSTWSPRGQTPVIRDCQRSWTKLNQISALAVSPIQQRVNLIWQWHGGKGVNQTTFQKFVRMLLRRVKGSVVLIMDNLRVHKSKSFQAYVRQTRRLRVEYLPAYAPELNPCELVFSAAKRVVANHGFNQIQDLQALADAHFTQWQQEQGKLKGYLRGVPYSIFRKKRRNLGRSQ